MRLRKLTSTSMYDEVPVVAPTELAAKQADGWMLLDVRTDEEWQSGRVDGSVHVPMHQVASRLGEISERVVCICAVGARSERVAQYLNQRGFEAVNLEGGVYGWVAEGKPIVA